MEKFKYSNKPVNNNFFKHNIDNNNNITVKDLKEFFAHKGLTVGETRSLLYRMLENLDTYQDENKLLIGNVTMGDRHSDENNYKPRILINYKKKETYRL